VIQAFIVAGARRILPNSFLAGIFTVMERLPAENPIIQKQIKLHGFHEHPYEQWPQDLQTTEDIIHALETRWLTLYGVKQGPAGYTLAFADENSGSCYMKEGFPEVETLKILEAQ
jgi:hypothetical protein